MNKLVINSLLAGMWAGTAALAATQSLSKAALWVAGIAALRGAVGYAAGKAGYDVPVDK